jgi:hypothetical protein
VVEQLPRCAGFHYPAPKNKIKINLKIKYKYILGSE